MDGMLLLDILFFVPIYTIAYDPCTIRLWFMSGGGLPCTIHDGLIVSDMPLSDGKAFNHSMAHSTMLITIIFGTFLKGIACVMDLQHSLTVLIDLSIAPTCSFFP